MSLGTTGANAVLNGLPSTVYLSLHTAAPGTTGASEATGYTRPSLTLAAAASGSRANSSTASFAAPTGTITNFGYWDAASGGNFLLGGALSSSQTFASGNTATVAAGAFSTTAS